MSNRSLAQLIANEQWAAVETRCQTHPHEAKEWITFRSHKQTTKLLPLHHACALDPTKRAVEALLHVYPDALMQKESFLGRTPLHIACKKGASFIVLQSLLRAGKGVELADTTGRTALHTAVASGATAREIRLLLLTYPEAAGRADEHGWLPIHTASRLAAPKEVLMALVQAFPEGIGAATNDGLTPTMCAPRGRRQMCLISSCIMSERCV